MAKPILVSGIQPSGRLHLGNYLGALENFVTLQNSGKYDCYFFIADLHSLTEPFDLKSKSKQILELAADFLAAGLDPKKSVIFQQSQISAVTELTWILNTLTPMGELERMTQFKEKSSREFRYKLFREGIKENSPEKYPANINVGLFNYPVLMAADVLIYDAKFVPVGHDQLQHLELARSIARKFNTRFGKTFIEPKAILTENPRVMSLANPEKKMSKSEPATCLFLDDSPEEIKLKIKRAVTDSGKEVVYAPEKKPAVSNLIKIYSALGNISVHKIEQQFAGKTYTDFKEKLTELITNQLENFRKNKKNLIKKPDTVIAVLNESSNKASERADKKIREIKSKIGIKI